MEIVDNNKNQLNSTPEDTTFDKIYDVVSSKQKRALKKKERKQHKKEFAAAAVQNSFQTNIISTASAALGSASTSKLSPISSKSPPSQSLSRNKNKTDFCGQHVITG